MSHEQSTEHPYAAQAASAAAESKDDCTAENKGYVAKRGTSDKHAQHAKPGANGKPGIVRFGQGLMLYAYHSGTKAWRTKVMRNGRETTLDLGTWPAMTLREARNARLALRAADDPAQERRQAKASAVLAQAQTLRAISEAWIEARAENQHWSEKHRHEVTRRLELHVWPRLGERPIADITDEELLRAIRAIDNGNGVRTMSVTAARVADHLRLIYDYAEGEVAALRNQRNPLLRLEQRLPRVTPTMHHQAAKTIEAARDVLWAVEQRARPNAEDRRLTLFPLGVLAHRLIALTCLRKEELLAARWDEIDLAKAVWIVPKERMKVKSENRGDFPVPLSRQAVELLRMARQMSRGELVFGGPAGRVGGKTLNNLMSTGQRQAGLKHGMVPHSWRGTFTTLMAEGGSDDDRHEVLEAVLAHTVPGVRGAYLQGWFLERRRPLMQRWADLLLPEGAPTAAELVGLAEPAGNVVALRRVA
jgi:integrase